MHQRDQRRTRIRRGSRRRFSRPRLQVHDRTFNRRIERDVERTLVPGRANHTCAVRQIDGEQVGLIEAHCLHGAARLHRPGKQLDLFDLGREVIVGDRAVVRCGNRDNIAIACQIEKPFDRRQRRLLLTGIHMIIQIETLQPPRAVGVAQRVLEHHLPGVGPSPLVGVGILVAVHRVNLTLAADWPPNRWHIGNGGVLAIEARITAVDISGTGLARCLDRALERRRITAPKIQFGFLSRRG